MVIGMTVVFGFLLMMVVVLNIQAKIIDKFFPQKVTVNPTLSTKKETPKNNEQIVGVIVAAITAFKKNKTK
jgi:oxaloacetate decarboxylase gamma subunit